MKKRTKLLLILAIPVQWLLMKALSFSPEFVEEYYAQGLYPSLSKALRYSFGWIPFSLGQLLFYAAITYLIIQLFKFIKVLRTAETATRKIISRSTTSSLAHLSIIYLLFNTLWAINYNREPLQQTFNLVEQKQDIGALKEMCLLLIERTNDSREQLGNTNDVWQEYESSNELLFQSAVNSYGEAEKTYPILRYRGASVKAVALPQLMSYAGIGGIYFPFTGEANVNTDPPIFKLPFTTCHEMAHQLGFASETDANFIAYLVCSSSSDPLFTYSGNLSAMRYSMSALYRSDSAAYRTLSKEYSKSLKADLVLNKAYWQQFESPFEDISDSINDAFLKANGQNEGIKSYGKMVELLLAHFAKNTIH